MYFRAGNLRHLLLALLAVWFGKAVPDDSERGKVEVVMRILGGPAMAKYLGAQLGYTYMGTVRGFSDTYILVPLFLNHSTFTKRGLDLSRHVEQDDRILWADEQVVKSRQKRDFWWPFLSEDQISARRPSPRIQERAFNDELWTQEWYLQDTRTRPDLPKLDLNVLPVYKMGITGKGVRVSVLDDGIEYTHEDLHKNYDPKISWDCNEDDDDPLPRYDSVRRNSHGTRCAGEIAMVANNEKCGVGVAHGAKIGGIKLLDGLVNDRIEGTALGYAWEIVDVYSSSWGPNDDGKTVDGPGRLAKEAFKRGILKGRDGKGSVYVWASGNGGNKQDNCNCDGYLASPYTISVGSASQKGEFPWYGEACASTMAVTYSSGAYQDQMIATTDLYNTCTTKHTGTSASAPLAAGIIALALEANSNLTWRDVQHLIVWTSEISPIVDNPGWQKNAAGFWFNTRFGFGLMNAYSLVNKAIDWIQVPEWSVCTIQQLFQKQHEIVFNRSVNAFFFSDGCNQQDNEVNFVEHAEVVTTLNYTMRGALQIFLTSPAGTEVQILSPRKLDDSREGFKKWAFMSVATWGESSLGSWAVKIVDALGPADNHGIVQDLTLRLSGTRVQTWQARRGVRNYSKKYSDWIRKYDEDEEKDSNEINDDENYVKSVY